MNKGIAVAGTVLLDKINSIAKYPSSGELTKILSVGKSVGGLVPNVGIDLKKIDKDLKVFGVGRIGNDGDGKFITDVLNKYGVDTSCIYVANNSYTSFTDVMSIDGGQRTFFTYMGACGEFGVDDIDFDRLDVDMLHLGYFLLLDKIDNGDGEKILKRAKEKGIKTSIDLVSENSDRYKLVLPCLKYTDNLIVNETEAGKLAGIEPERKNLKAVCEKLFSLGVKERVIIHMPEIGVCMSKGGYTEVPSFDLNKGYIEGTTGAGDAFCAGSLYGIYKGFSDKEILEFASECAVVSLRKADAVSGMTDFKSIREFCTQFKRKK